MKDSETFGVEQGHGQKIIDWLNDTSNKDNLKLEARLYGYNLETENFGSFEMFSWIGNVQSARKLIVKASKRFKVKVIEGGYKTKEKTFHLRKSDFAMVRRGDKVIGHLELDASRFGKGNWIIKNEERR